MRGLKAILAAAAWLAVSCAPASKPDCIGAKGVSLALAESREAAIGDLRYHLEFDLPADPLSEVQGNSTAIFEWKGGADTLYFDFKSGTVNSLLINGEIAPYSFHDEHIAISADYLRAGRDTVSIGFSVVTGSLNRRPDMVYTLSVPDRARTLFPCFDQPGLKARYNLTLHTPQEWYAISNSPLISDTVQDGRRTSLFRESEPLSTYLFAFVAGGFTRVEKEKNGMVIGLYHRETDPFKSAQCEVILDEVFECVEWLEEYSGIAFPFAKYDLIILPGFQFGGMEHTGATLYNDRRMFLERNGGIQEQMSRYSLIAHETAHMWFGDLVTMEWFNDVWTKEIFANYFAAEMTSLKYPDVDSRISRLQYIRSAFEEDRTSGANPIKQPLDNLRYAGLMYGNIIYNRAPVVMEMLVEKCGKEPFRNGIREYLETYSYGNATWEQLIEILDRQCDDNLTEWSRNWVFTAGIPEISMPVDGSLPRFDTLYYGYYPLKGEVAAKTMEYALEEASYVNRAYALLHLNESAINGSIDAESYIRFLLRFLEKEEDVHPFSQAASYLGNTLFRYCFGAGNDYGAAEAIRKMMETKESPECRKSLFSLMVGSCTDSTTTSLLYEAFIHPEDFSLLTLDENRLTSLAYELAVRLPEKSTEILALQRGRITNADRLAAFDFISPAASADGSIRDSLFHSLLTAENRKIEPWAISALSLLNHQLRMEESEKYILPGLQLLPEVQATGDIFFPKNWASALLSRHKGVEQQKIVGQFLEEENCIELLKNKVRLVANEF